MNLYFVNATSKWGGVKTWTLDIARGLADRGHGIIIAGRPGPFVDKARELGLDARAMAFGMDFNPLRIADFMGQFRRERIDAVVVNVGKDMRTAGIAARLLGIPVIHRVGLAGDMENTAKVRLLHQWVRPAIMVPCDQIKQGMLRRLPYLGPEEITVIRTGKDPVPQLPADVHTPLRLISTSQLNRDKGHEDVFRALALLKKQDIQPTYRIVGTGTCQDELTSLARELDIEDQIEWRGFCKNVRAELRACDLFLLPSHMEGLPNSLLEAMAEGLVCVARDVGGIHEVWPDQVASLLLPPTAGPDAFARSIADLASLPEEIYLDRRRIFHTAAQENTRADMTNSFERLLRSQIAGSQQQDRS